MARGGSLVRIVCVAVVISLAVLIGNLRADAVVCAVVGQGNWILGAHPKHLELPLTMRELEMYGGLIAPLLLMW
jgi:hypothetical protein